MFLAAAACIALLMVVVGFAWLKLRDPIYRTAIGEQQTVTLNDGTRITLNTDTQLVVSYRQTERHIRLDHGEAMFEVAKQPQRPFIVQVGDQQVRALGITFIVRRDADRDAVVLIEWGERFPELIPTPRTEIRLMAEGEDRRRIEVSAAGGW